MFAKQSKITEKNKRVDCLACTLDAILLENMLTGKGARAAIADKGAINADEGTFRAGQDCYRLIL